MKLSTLAKMALAMAALAASLPALCAEHWLLTYKADYSLWSDDPYPLTDLHAILTTKGSTTFPEGPGKKVTAIAGLRNGVVVTGLWTQAQGNFFGGWTPAQGILDRKKSVNGQLIPFDGLAYVTADGIQHVLYGATIDLGGQLVTTYFEMDQWASSNPSTPWVTFGGTTVKLERID